MANPKFLTEDITEKRFRDLLFIYRFGSVPFGIKNVSKLRSLYSAIVSVCFFSMYVAEWLGVFQSDELKHMMKMLRFAIPHTFVVLLDIIFRFRKDEYDKLLKMTEMFLWEDMPEKDSKSGKLTMAGWIPRVQRITKNIVIYVMVIHFIQSCIRIINNHELMFVAWYPFDISSSPQFEIVYITQAVGLLLGLPTSFAFPAMYVTSICIACSQLEKLQCKFLRIKQKQSKQNEEASLSFNNDFQMQNELNECVQHHQSIIRYLNALETAMNIPVGGILLIQLITLCTIAFSVIMSWGDILDMVQGATIYIVMLGLVFTFCGMGTVVTDKNESLREVAWSSDWVGTPLSYQRCILFIIAKANQEFHLTAGKFVPLSNSTMMSILNESLSFFMFLLAVKDQEKEIDNE